jgi:hypothetical protein
MHDIEQKLPFVDDSDVVQKSESDPLLRAALELSRPVNWWGTGLPPDSILPIGEQGIPIKWVPVQDVLTNLAAAPPDDQVAVIEANQKRILGDCRAIIDKLSDSSLSDARRLVLRAFDTFSAGYHEGALALSVAVAEEHALWAGTIRAGLVAAQGGGNLEEIVERYRRNLRRKKYQLARIELGSGTLSHDFDVPRKALIAPIPKFFTPFYPGSGQPAPDALSRHVVAHRPTIGHFSTGNAILAMMLATSLLKEREEYREYICLDV